MVAPTIQNPSCQEQLAEAARQVARSVDNVADTAQSTCRDDNALQELGDSANAVQSALNDLLAHIKQGMATGQEVSCHLLVTFFDVFVICVNFELLFQPTILIRYFFRCQLLRLIITIYFVKLQLFVIYIFGSLLNINYDFKLQSWCYRT